MKKLRLFALVFAAVAVIAALVAKGPAAASFGQQEHSKQVSTDKTGSQQGMRMSDMLEHCGQMMGNTRSMGMQGGMPARCRRMMGRMADTETRDDTQRPAMGSMCR